MQINVAIKNTTSTDYNVHVYDLFGGGHRPVKNDQDDPYPLAGGETSPPFQVNTGSDGNGAIEYRCDGGPSLSGITVADGTVAEIR